MCYFRAITIKGNRENQLLMDIYENSILSIVVPVFNIENEISRCVNSLLNQTYKNIEILLVDDGSTDSSGKICDDYALKDNRVRVFHKKMEGLALHVINEFVYLYYDENEFMQIINKLSDGTLKIKSNDGFNFVKNNTWKKRARVISEIIGA